MTSPYVAIFAAPGSRAFSAAGLIGRMPLSMLGIGIVTMISQVTGQYGLAGGLSATTALSGAAIGPLVSRLVDRYGQARVLRPAAAVTVLSVAVLLLGVRAGAPHWVFFLGAAGVGATPSLGAMVRARWSVIHRDAPELLHTAYSFESVVDEIVFIVGPILSVGLCTVWFAEAGPLLAAAFLGIGVLLLAAQRGTEPRPHPRAHHAGGSALRAPGMPVLVVVFTGMGAMFGAVEVITLAFADERGHKALASLVLATYALGSCLAGVVFGLAQPRGSARGRFLLGVVLMAVSMIPPLLVGNLVFLAMALFVSGLTIAPTMVTTMSLVERIVPRARLTEGITWTSTGLAVGVSLGAALAGRVTDAHGASTAFAVPAGAAFLAAAAAGLGYRRLRPAPEREDVHGEYDGDEERDAFGALEKHGDVA
ncbi:MFS transporter [Streptomyces sp. NPDC021224]|uniref:MFS transporter n=1 Tax=unclassified Streptomyces TaxID=2593676 RepID=UPI0037B7E43F